MNFPETSHPEQTGDAAKHGGNRVPAGGSAMVAFPDLADGIGRAHGVERFCDVTSRGAERPEMRHRTSAGCTLAVANITGIAAGAPRARAAAAAGVMAVHPRHHHIEQNQVGRERLRARDRFLARAAEVNGKTAILTPGASLAMARMSGSSSTLQYSIPGFSRT